MVRREAAPPTPGGSGPPDPAPLAGGLYVLACRLRNGWAGPSPSCRENQPHRLARTTAPRCQLFHSSGRLPIDRAAPTGLVPFAVLGRLVGLSRQRVARIVADG